MTREVGRQDQRIAFNIIAYSDGIPVKGGQANLVFAIGRKAVVRVAFGRCSSIAKVPVPVVDIPGGFVGEFCLEGVQTVDGIDKVGNTGTRLMNGNRQTNHVVAYVC